MTLCTQKVYALSLCLIERDPQCQSIFQTVQEIDTNIGKGSYGQTQAASMANIFNLYSEKLFHIIKQTLTKMNQNPQTYTFALQTLSQNHYKFFALDCLYNTLYMEGMLNNIDQQLNSDRINIVKSIKFPLFEAIQLLKDRYVQNQFVKKQSQQQRTLIISILYISILNDMSQGSWNASSSQINNQNPTFSKYKKYFSCKIIIIQRFIFQFLNYIQK